MSKKRVRITFINVACFAALFAAAFFAASCGGKQSGAKPASMDTLYAQNGRPVSGRQLAPEDFSTYLKYATVLSASSESTAYAPITDVVRKINAKVGDRVARDDIVVSLSEDNQTYLQAVAAFNDAKSSFDRTQALFNSADISRQQYDDAKAQYDIASSRLAAARDLVFVRSPISGIVTSIEVHLTENIKEKAPLFTVSGGSAKDAAFEGDFYVGSDEIAEIQSGARAFINGASRVQGHIIQISQIMDPVRQSYQVRASFPRGPEGQKDGLVSGLALDVEVETYRNLNAIVVSSQELVKTDSGFTAFTAVDNVAKLVNVKTGHQQGLRYEVTDGLKAGDILLTQGSQPLADGTKVMVQQAGTAQTAAATAAPAAQTAPAKAQ